MGTQIRGSGLAAGGRPVLAEPDWLSERSFRRGDVPAVRRFARSFGTRAGLASARLSDFVLAVSEASACATAWGPCTARVRLWVSRRRAFCEVRGDGRLLRRVPYGAVPVDTAARGAGPSSRQDEEETLRRLVLQQLSDYVSVAGGPDGIRVMLSMTVA
jgi:hypothetical protein